MGPKGRYVLRATAVAVAACLAALKSSVGDGIDNGEWVDIAQATFTGLMTYLGLGALVPQLEPNVGMKIKDATVVPVTKVKTVTIATLVVVSLALVVVGPAI